MRVKTVMPSESALTSATRSAHRVSPYVAFSMLHPVIDPPVGALERGADLEAGIVRLSVAARIDGGGEKRLFRLVVHQQRLFDWHGLPARFGPSVRAAAGQVPSLARVSPLRPIAFHVCFTTMFLSTPIGLRPPFRFTPAIARPAIGLPAVRVGQ